MPSREGLNFPFNTVMALNPERNDAGYIPARIPTATANTNMYIHIMGVKKWEYERSLPDNVPINEMPGRARVRAIAAAARDIRMDSIRNCHIRLRGLTPNTFRTPISFALSRERAVDRFIKLIQAISTMKTAIQENKYTLSRLPVGPGCLIAAECR